MGGKTDWRHHVPADHSGRISILIGQLQILPASGKTKRELGREFKSTSRHVQVFTQNVSTQPGAALQSSQQPSKSRRTFTTMMTTRRAPFGDLSNKENIMGTVGVRKAVASAPQPFMVHTNSQEEKEVVNELSEQVSLGLPCCSPCALLHLVLFFFFTDGCERDGGRGRGSSADQRVRERRAAAPRKPAPLRHVPHRVRGHLGFLQEGSR